MNIREAKIIPIIRIFDLAEVSRDHGRDRVRDLVDENKISLKRTPTGREFVSFGDAEIIADALC